MPTAANTRMLTFDQESNWYPTLLNNGRVLYTRYEYANVSHQFGRLLFHMNPDGTGQMEYYGSNSYWPNSIFYARPIPDHPTMVVGVVCGHHGPNATGRLVLFDPARGRRETVRRRADDSRLRQDRSSGSSRTSCTAATGPSSSIPGRSATSTSWSAPGLHPEQVEYGIYLVDVFDNITEICRLPGLLAARADPAEAATGAAGDSRPRRPGAKEATVYLADVYQGPGLRGRAAGHGQAAAAVHLQLRLSPHRSNAGFGHLATPGVDGPWEPRYLLGTVPVEEDGSALFNVPANTPISVQPLDAEGRALQLMRSWFTAMPGEVLSCVGLPRAAEQLAARRSTRPPALGAAERDRALARPAARVRLRARSAAGAGPLLRRLPRRRQNPAGPTSPASPRRRSSASTRPITRRPRAAIRTMLTPVVHRPASLRPPSPRREQLRRPGRRRVLRRHQPAGPDAQARAITTSQLDEEAWDRLYTWIDLGAPDHGSWKYSEWGVPDNYYERRLEMLRRDSPAAPTTWSGCRRCRRVRRSSSLPPPAETDADRPARLPGLAVRRRRGRRRAGGVGLPKTHHRWSWPTA